MNSRNNRRAPKRKVTGRFFALLSCALVLLVMLVVFLTMRGRTQPEPQPVSAPAPAEQAGQQPIEPDPEPVATVKADADLGAKTGLDGSWTNILLLGSDARDMSLIDSERSDTIIIASVNNQTGQLKLTSVMRDMEIEIPGHGMQKVNAATKFGGPALMMQVLNQNLGLNITKYAIVNFEGMARIIDILGGVLVDITKDEVDIINQHMGEIAQYTMTQEDYLAQKESMKLTSYGTGKRLNGIQAVTYARIRKLDGGDYQRTLRQKNVIKAMMKAVQGAGPAQLMQIGTTALSHLQTNVSLAEAVTLGIAILGSGLEDKERVKEFRIPDGETSKTETRNGVSGLYDVNYEALTAKIYQFIYQ